MKNIEPGVDERINRYVYKSEDEYTTPDLDVETTFYSRWCKQCTVRKCDIYDINRTERMDLIPITNAFAIAKDYKIKLNWEDSKTKSYSYTKVFKNGKYLFSATYNQYKSLSYIDRDMKVPKNSKFNALRDILPKDFEWIKTRTRLADESVMQSHCVYSYAGDIKSDKCAIYSYLDEEGKYGKPSTRYTIEFAVSRKGYVIRQMQKAHNHGGSTSLAKEIKNLIKNSNEGQLKTA
jgi:hypothetical protein